MSFLHNAALFLIVCELCVWVYVCVWVCWGGGAQTWDNVPSGLDKANPCSPSSKIYQHDNPETGRNRSRKENLGEAGGSAVIVQHTMMLIPKE